MARLRRLLPLLAAGALAALALRAGAREPGGRPGKPLACAESRDGTARVCYDDEYVYHEDKATGETLRYRIIDFERLRFNVRGLASVRVTEDAILAVNIGTVVCPYRWEACPFNVRLYVIDPDGGLAEWYTEAARCRLYAGCWVTVNVYGAGTALIYTEPEPS